MATALEVFVGLSWLISLVLDIAAAGYCYRITRITGAFTAWWLMILFAIFFAVSSFFSVSYSVLSSETFATASSAPALTYVAVFDVVLDLILSVLLFGAMLGLFRTFHSQKKRTEPLVQVSP